LWRNSTELSYLQYFWTIICKLTVDVVYAMLYVYQKVKNYCCNLNSKCYIYRKFHSNTSHVLNRESLNILEPQWRLYPTPESLMYVITENNINHYRILQLHWSIPISVQTLPVINSNRKINNWLCFNYCNNLCYWINLSNF